MALELVRGLLTGAERSAYFATIPAALAASDQLRISDEIIF
jgi:hypothetical protein